MTHALEKYLRLVRSPVKKNILLFCALLLMSGCALELPIYITLYIVGTVVERNNIQDLNADCLKREGMECLAMQNTDDHNNIHSLKGLAAGKDALFLADGNRVVKVDLKKKKAVVIARGNEWKIFHDSIYGYEQKDESENLRGVGLIGDELYIGASVPVAAQKIQSRMADDSLYFDKIDNLYLRRLRVDGGKAISNMTISPDKIPPSFQSMISDGSALYFTDNTRKRIVKVEVSSGRSSNMLVIDKEKPAYINSMNVIGNFVYFTACESGNCRFMRLDMKSGRSGLLFKRYALRTFFRGDIEEMPENSKSLIAVFWRRDGRVRFRVFDKDGKIVFDKTEKEMRHKRREIRVLKRQLEAAGSTREVKISSAIEKNLRLITELPLLRETTSSNKKCFDFNDGTYIAKDADNIYFNGSCLSVFRFNVKNEKIDELSSKLERARGLIEGMAVWKDFLYIVERFSFSHKLLVRRVNIKNGNGSYLGGVSENL